MKAAYDKKLDTIHERLNQLNEEVRSLREEAKSKPQEFKQIMNVLHQILNNVDDDKKKLRSSSDERYLQERMVNAVTQSITSIMGNEVEYVIKEEISGNVLPCKDRRYEAADVGRVLIGIFFIALKNTMDTFGQQLHTKLTQHLNSADQQLKEYIVKTVHKKVTIVRGVFTKVVSN